MNANGKMIRMTPPMLLDALKTGYQLGTITVHKPISSTRLVNALAARRNIKTNAREIRDAVNTLADAGEYVGSTSRGYFYAPTFDDMTVAINFYSSYIAEYGRRRAAMLAARERVREPEQDMFGHPVVGALKKEFGAERIINSTKMGVK